MNKLDEIKKLLEMYDEAYYNQEKPLITDREYDKLKEEYLSLGGIDFISGEIKNGEKVKHTFYASSLEKVKITEQDKLRKMIEKLFPVVIEYKFDGLTEVDYGDKLVSRGNGEYGEDKTDKRPYIKGIGTYFGMPIRGEVMMLKEDFYKINEELVSNGKDKLENCRNGASGMMNRKDSIPKGLTYFAYYVDGIINPLEQIKILKEHGYNCLDGYVPKTVDEAVDHINNFNRDNLPFDIDGLVIKSLRDEDFGGTQHHPKNSFALKWKDDSVETTLRSVDFSIGKTGLLTCTANFDTIKIEGSNVSFASVHNVGIIKKLQLGIGDKITVYKANMIIPQIEDNLTRSDTLEIPTHCPVCGELLIKKDNDSDLLYCSNKYCKEKVIAQAVHMCSRDCLDIKDLSEETIRKMYDFINNDNKEDFTFPLYFIYDNIIKLEGYAEKSAKKLHKEIQDKSKDVPFQNFLNACNVPLLGKSASKVIAKEYESVEDFIEDIEIYNGRKLLSIDGFGEELYKSILNNLDNIYSLAHKVDGIKYTSKNVTESKINGKMFVITGKLKYFSNRDELINKIESLGGKVSGSISTKSSYLINNDKESTSSKNKKAQQLNIPIISEEEFLEMVK